MKEIIYIFVNIILMRFLKIFFLLLFIVFQNNTQAQCLGSQTASMSPAGPYFAGQVVTVTYTLSSFIQLNGNWIIAFDIGYGNGWSSISPISAPGNSGGSGGSWIWDTQNTYPNGLNYGPGYRFQNNGNANWGTFSTGPFTLSFQLTVGSFCNPQDLSIDLSVIDDCQTGGFSCLNCPVNNYSIYNGSSSVITPSVTTGANQTICNGGTPSNLTAIGSSSGGAYSWNPQSDFTNPNLQNPSFNGGVNTTSVYTVTFTDANGCIATDIVTITVNPVPSVTLSVLPNPACVGDDIVLTANPSIAVSEYKFMYNDGAGWSGNNVTNPAWDINNPVIYNSINQSTDFRVKVREAGCSSIWSPTITVPIVTFNPLSIWHN